MGKRWWGDVFQGHHTCAFTASSCERVTTAMSRNVAIVNRDMVCLWRVAAQVAILCFREIILSRCARLYCCKIHNPIIGFRWLLLDGEGNWGGGWIGVLRLQEGRRKFYWPKSVVRSTSQHFHCNNFVPYTHSRTRLHTHTHTLTYLITRIFFKERKKKKMGQPNTKHAKRKFENTVAIQGELGKLRGPRVHRTLVARAVYFSECVLLACQKIYRPEFRDWPTGFEWGATSENRFLVSGDFLLLVCLQ